MTLQHTVTTHPVWKESSRHQHQSRRRLTAAAGVVVTAILLLVGCHASAPPDLAPVNRPPEASSPTDVTLYLAGMNESMQILWGDWPNKVKQALLELDGVESVEDEWERELESQEDLDVLFVTYDTKRITTEQLIEAIAEHGFKAQIKTE